MNELDDNPKKGGSLPGWAWALIILIVGAPLLVGIGAVVMVITGLTVIGSNLESTFEQVSSEVEQQRIDEP